MSGEGLVLLLRRGLAALLLLALLLLLGGVVASGWQLYGQQQQVRQLQEDRAELNNVRYGLLSVDAWEQQLTAIVARQIEAFELTGEGREELRLRLEELIRQLIDATSEVMRSSYQQQGGVGGWFKERMFALLVDVEGLKRDAPQIAEAFVRYLDEPEHREQLQLYIAAQIRSYTAETMGETDYTLYNQLVANYQAADGAAALEQIGGRLQELEAAARQSALWLLLAALPLVIAPLVRWRWRLAALYLALLLALVLLTLGVTLPMIEIDARIGTLSFRLAGDAVLFRDQVLFFQSKSILEVVEVLVMAEDRKLAAVGGLVLLFSVLFPVTKMVLTAFWLGVARMRERGHALVTFFVFRSGKWSMADVMVVAIFMAYLGFAGVMDSQLRQLERLHGELQVVTTSSSELQIGFYLFTAFCLLGLMISQLAGDGDESRRLARSKGL